MITQGLCKSMNVGVAALGYERFDGGATPIDTEAPWETGDDRS